MSLPLKPSKGEPTRVRDDAETRRRGDVGMGAGVEHTSVSPSTPHDLWVTHSRSGEGS